MIIKEEYMTRADGVKLFRTYSDEGKFIIQNETGIEYAEAIDAETAPYTYSEGNVMLIDENAIIREKAEAYDVLMGVTE